VSPLARGQRVTVWPPDRGCDGPARAELYPPAWTGDVLLVDLPVVSVQLDDGRVRWFHSAEVARIHE